MVCYEIEITGNSDHAGAPPMSLRKFALFVTQDIILDVRHQMDKIEHQLVYTIVRMNISPNIHTVIPNKFVFSLEARHQDADTIKQVEAIIQSLAKSSGKGNCEVKATKLWDRDTVWFDKKLVHSLEKSVETLGYPYKRMVSGAGHDAQFIRSEERRV